MDYALFSLKKYHQIQMSHDVIYVLFIDQSFSYCSKDPDPSEWVSKRFLRKLEEVFASKEKAFETWKGWMSSYDSVEENAPSYVQEYRRVEAKELSNVNSVNGYEYEDCYYIKTPGIYNIKVYKNKEQYDDKASTHYNAHCTIYKCTSHLEEFKEVEHEYHCNVMKPILGILLL